MEIQYTIKSIIQFTLPRAPKFRKLTYMLTKLEKASGKSKM